MRCSERGHVGADGVGGGRQRHFAGAPASSAELPPVRSEVAQSALCVGRGNVIDIAGDGRIGGLQGVKGEFWRQE